MGAFVPKVGFYEQMLARDVQPTTQEEVARLQETWGIRYSWVDALTFNGAVHGYGDEIKISVADYESTIDRDGNSFLDDDEEAQVKRYGRIRISDRPPPERVTEPELLGNPKEKAQYAALKRDQEEATAHGERRVHVIRNTTLQGPRTPEEWQAAFR